MTEFNIFGAIDSWNYTRERLKATLDGAGGEEVVFNISSEGGSVVEGLAIAAMIAEYKGKTTANILGISASIATIISIACDEVKMPSNGLFMIHNSAGGWGMTKEEKEKDIKILATIDEMMLKAYVEKVEMSGKLINGDKEKTTKVFRQMMIDETWLNPQEALDYGLIDTIQENASSTDLTAFARLRAHATNYKNLPSNIKNDMQKEEKKGMLSALATFFGFKAEIKEIEAVEDTEVEAPEVVAETPEDAPTATADPQDAKLAEMEAKMQEMQAAIDSKTKEFEALEIKAQAIKADYKEEPKVRELDSSGLPKEAITQLSAFVKKMFNK
jgi:ATP-dependent protease ClpP protease subunit